MNINIIQHTKTPSESIKRLLTELGQQQTTLHYGKAVSKLEQYQYFTDNKIPCPKWTVDYNIASKWLKEGNVVFARQQVKSGTGKGIIVVEPGNILPEECKVYTQYIKKKREFRVNLFQHKLVNVREKVKEKGKPGSFYIRNKENGFTTTYPQGPLPKGLEDLAIKASLVSDSDFIGVDVGYNEYLNLLFVLEVNSGPSIEGSSVKEFATKIKETYQNV